MKTRLSWINLFFLLSFSLLGCTKQIMPMSSYSHPPERVLKKNYVLNEVKSVTVGEPVLIHKDYFAFKRTMNKLRATGDFRVEAKKWSFSGKQNDLFPIEGIVIEDGQQYYLLPLSDDTNTMYYSLLINKDGYFSKKSTLRIPQLRYNNKAIPKEYTWIEIVPPNTKFIVAEEDVVDTTAGFTNFEIVYTGKNSQSLTFLYREYTPQDMIRPAYSQSLTYSADSKIIRFKKIKIRIQNVTDDGIEYAVIEE